MSSSRHVVITRSFRLVMEDGDDTLVISRKNGADDHAAAQVTRLESVLLDQILACPTRAYRVATTSPSRARMSADCSGVNARLLG